MTLFPTPPDRRLPWLFIAAFFVVLVLRLLAYTPGETRLISDGWRLLTWCLLPLLWLTLVEQRMLKTALHPVSARSRGIALLAALALIMLIVIGYRLTFHHWTGIPLGRPWTDYALVVPSLLLVGFAEEFVFRGVFLSGLIRADWKPLSAHLVTNGLFAVSHFPGWLVGNSTMGPMDWITATLRLFLFGMAMSGLVTLEGGLLLAVLVHTFNDAWVGLFLT